MSFAIFLFCGEFFRLSNFMVSGLKGRQSGRRGERGEGRVEGGQLLGELQRDEMPNLGSICILYFYGSMIQRDSLDLLFKCRL